jgi:hypothetical protein
MMSSAVAFQMKGLRVGVPVFGPGGDGVAEFGDADEPASTRIKP